MDQKTDSTVTERQDAPLLARNPVISLAVEERS